MDGLVDISLEGITEGRSNCVIGGINDGFPDCGIDGFVDCISEVIGTWLGAEMNCVADGSYEGTADSSCEVTFEGVVVPRILGVLVDEDFKVKPESVNKD